MYTVKQLADLAGVSVRTLHYYDEIALLQPAVVGDNSYRYYDEDNLLRLQQILFYREIGLGLLQIKDLLDAPDFDLLTALRSHRTLLLAKMTRLEQLVHTVDSTILHLVGEVRMRESHLFSGFSAAQLEAYTEEARTLYGEAPVNESLQRWQSYGKEKQQQIQAEGGANYAELARLMTLGESPSGDAAQAVLARWHEHMRYFYEPTPEILRGLGQLYNQHPEFIATFQAFHPDLPAYLEAAIAVYCDHLDDALLAELLAQDAAG